MSSLEYLTVSIMFSAGLSQLEAVLQRLQSNLGWEGRKEENLHANECT